MHIVTKGIVLREVNYKEADKILTVLTEEGGKRTVKSPSQDTKVRFIGLLYPRKIPGSTRRTTLVG